MDVLQDSYGCQKYNCYPFHSSLLESTHEFGGHCETSKYRKSILKCLLVSPLNASRWPKKGRLPIMPRRVYEIICFRIRVIAGRSRNIGQ